MEVPSPAGLGVGDVNFPRTRLLCDGCPPLGWDGGEKGEVVTWTKAAARGA